MVKKSLFWRLLNGKEDLVQDYGKGVRTITIGMDDRWNSTLNTAKTAADLQPVSTPKMSVDGNAKRS